MPSQKSRSKEDTWTTDELNKALKLDQYEKREPALEEDDNPSGVNKFRSRQKVRQKTSDRRHHRDRDEDRKRDRINGEDKHRRRRDDEIDRHRGRDDDDRRRRKKHEDEDDGPRLTEDDRERQRQERREKREKDSKSKKEIPFRGKTDRGHIDLQEIDDGFEEKQSRHKEDRDRRHREDRYHGDRDDYQGRRHRDHEEKHEKRHRDGEEDSDRRRRHRDVEEEENERERRRKERRKEKEAKEEEGRKRRHEEKRDRHRQEDKRERRSEKDERSDRHKDRKDRDRERDRDERRREEREDRRREKEERHRQKDRDSDQRHRISKKEEEKVQEPQQGEEDDYNYEEDFEDYEEDFEEDDDEDDAGSNIQDSEVGAVLKALDAENDRLIRESSRSPKVLNDYGQRNGDDDEDSDDRYEKSYQPRMERPRTAINFVSAKQRAINKKTASKTLQRGSDLLKMLELDFISFDVLDMPPVNEYDLYIRAFGGINTKQAYVQTNDDNVDRDIQTEEVDSRQKWTQHPPEDFAGCGRGDGEKDFEEEEESQSKQNREQDTSRFNAFMEKAGQVMAMLLEESKDEEGDQMGKHKSHIAVSEGYTDLELLPILAGRHVVYSHFSPVQPNLLLTIYSPAPNVSGENPVSKRGIICVWNTNEPSYPQKLLACASQPRCCCFSPVKPSLVFAGMQDGSLAMWDLRETSSLHQPTVVQDQSYFLRYPTYDTAAVLSEENHHSPVTCISPIYSYINSSKSGSQVGSQATSASEDSTSGLSFQLVSTEEIGILHFWVVAELGTPDMSGSTNDLGLAPGGTVKLIKSSSLSPDSSNKDSRLKVTGVKALDMQLLPADPNQYYIATDSGCVLHGVRFGKRAYPRAHSPVIESIVDVLSIDFSPFEKPCFLAGCSDGSVSLYHTKSANPLITWPTVTKGRAVMCVRWSRSRPCVFYILDATSNLYVFDLLEGDMGPKFIEQISKDRVTSCSMTNDFKASGLGTPGKHPQILFGLESGKTEIHTVSKSLREPEDLEQDYLNSYLQRF